VGARIQRLYAYQNNEALANTMIEMSNHLVNIETKTKHLVGRFITSGQSVDVVNEFELFAFKLMAFIIFSKDIDADTQLNKEVKEMYELLRRSQRALGTLGHVPLYYSVATKFPWLVPANDRFTSLAQRITDRRKKVSCLYQETLPLFSLLLFSSITNANLTFIHIISTQHQHHSSILEQPDTYSIPGTKASQMLISYLNLARQHLEPSCPPQQAVLYPGSSMNTSTSNACSDHHLRSNTPQTQS
jgi:hypothetical protein